MYKKIEKQEKRDMIEALQNGIADLKQLHSWTEGQDNHHFFVKLLDILRRIEKI